MIGVTALSGMMPLFPGNTQIRLHRRAMALPDSMVKGISRLWLELPVASRAMCGTASPMKETGPQNAVVTAVSSPVAKSSQGVQGLDQQGSNEQSDSCQQTEVRQLREGDPSEIAESPHDEGMYLLRVGEEIQQGDGR